MGALLFGRVGHTHGCLGDSAKFFDYTISNLREGKVNLLISQGFSCMTWFWAYFWWFREVRKCDNQLRSNIWLDQLCNEAHRPAVRSPGRVGARTLMLCFIRVVNLQEFISQLIFQWSFQGRSNQSWRELESASSLALPKSECNTCQRCVTGNPGS